MVAGLAIQVASLTVFTVVGAEFALRVHKNQHRLSPTHADIYTSRRFKLFLGGKSHHRIVFFVAKLYLVLVIYNINSHTPNIGLALATVCVFTRSVFRAVELSDGFTGHLANDEVSFMILDGALIMIACGAFTLLHPGYCFTKAGWAASSYPFLKKSEKKIARDEERNEKREARKQTIPEAKEM